jgi:hypothetical protein
MMYYVGLDQGLQILELIVLKVYVRPDCTL